MVFDDLKKNEYYIHKKYGVCQFLGIDDDWVFYFKFARNSLVIARKNIDEQLKNYIIPYDGDRENIILDNMGGNAWSNAKRKARKEAQKMAKDLMDIAAKRKQLKGFKFSKDTEKQIKFENSFPFELSEGQKKTIREIKQDMESDKCMNRVLLGDTGFGKTKVLECVIYKAIQDKKQAILLAPTTILARQHYDEFTSDLKNIEIGFLCSSTTKKEKERILQDLSEGTISIVIGTNSVVDEKVKYKDLGLIVIDEEQRQGVKTKNDILNYHPTVDTLYASATTIPRTTFEMKVGIKDISVIDTPPANKKPINTKAIKWDDDIIKQYINRELERNGQIYFLYNNVAELENMKERLLKLDSRLKIGIINGKMKTKDVAEYIERFKNKEYNLLLCTTIIETGVSINTANTILVYQANMLGLSQAHQIRGRVGRGCTQGYCLLITETQLNPIATQRLRALEENTRLGAGIDLAESDLKLRGQGQIFGTKQSGKQYRRIGYTLYNEILENTIKEEMMNS